jgi:hypothetical protein
MARNVRMKDVEVGNEAPCDCKPAGEKVSKKSWETPKLEDVSGKIMAQPYIRFT